MFTALPSWISLLAKSLFTTKRGSARRAGLARTLRFEPMEQRQLLAVLTVNLNQDNTTADSSLTLREAAAVVNFGTMSGVIPDLGRTLAAGEIAQINTTASFGTNDKIQFISSGEILLDRAMGQIEIRKSVVIDASTLSSGVIINGNDPTPGEQTGTGIRIFNITDPSGGTSPPLVELKKLTMRGGDVETNGGAIRSETRLIIRSSTIEQNAANFGGAVYVAVAGGSSTPPREILRIEDSVIQNNDAFTGGGIAIVSGSTGAATADTISITRTTINNNHAISAFSGSGGGLYAQLHGARLTVSESTISGNTADASGGFSYAGGGGGGIYAELRESASLTVDKTVVDGNTATYGDGGGITAKAFDNNVATPFPTPRAITITRSTISNNTANDRGGGLFAFNREGTETLVEESRITGNHAPFNPNVFASHRNGGGIYAYVWDESYAANNGALTPKFTITRSTVDNNDAHQKGGGVFVCSKFFGNFIFTNTTLSANRTTDESNGAGGGVYIAHFPLFSESVDAWLTNLTVTQNVSAWGGGVAINDENDTRVRIANSIISDNWGHQPAPNNLVGRVDVASFKHNLIGSSVQVKDLDGTIVLQDLPSVNTIPVSNNNILFNNAPYLAPLADNGGPTPTHALRFEPQNYAVSPAIDAGSNALAVNPLTSTALTTDQRGVGFPRAINIPGVRDPGVIVDIGAFELGAVRVTNVAIGGSFSTHPKFSFNGPDDKLDADGSGRQLVTVPVGFANTVEITFSANVQASLLSSHLFIRGLLFGSSPVLAPGGFSYDPNTNTAKWVYSISTFLTDQYVISLSDNVIDATGLKLDGEWTNPKFTTTVSDAVSKFPSGNGTAGGRFTFVFSNLHGDANRDNVVNADDQAIYNTNVNVVTQNATFAQGDFNGDGAVTSADGWAFAANLNVNLQGLVWADFTADSKVNTADEQEAYNGQSVEPWHSGDVNGDGVVNSADFDLYNLHSSYFVGNMPLKIVIAPW